MRNRQLSVFPWPVLDIMSEQAVFFLVHLDKKRGETHSLRTQLGHASRAVNEADASHHS